MTEDDALEAIANNQRLEYIRQEIRAERISYGEIVELQSLASHIHPSDTELLEWAGVPEKMNDLGTMCGDCEAFTYTDAEGSCEECGGEKL